jgi:glucose-1-phosphate thymidylyltransferase
MVRMAASVITTAAILARGLGSRMRRDDPEATLDPAQARAAEQGLKGMIRIERPFLDYVLSALADAGIREVVLVIGPEHDAVRDYFVEEAPPQRVRVRFAEQAHPRGTADAVVAAAEVIGASPFLVLNADNLYPAAAVRALAARDGAGVVAFERDALVADGAIAPERIRAFAVLDIASDDTLRAIREKPGEDFDVRSEAARWVSMNLWAVTPAIVEACRTVAPSARGELELPDAITGALRNGTRVDVVRVREGVLDLSVRGDIARVAARLQHVDVSP